MPRSGGSIFVAGRRVVLFAAPLLALGTTSQAADCSIVEAMRGAGRPTEEALGVVLKLTVEGAVAGQAACLAAAGAPPEQIVAIALVDAHGLTCDSLIELDRAGVPTEGLVGLVESASRRFTVDDLACAADGDSGLPSAVVLAVGLRVGSDRVGPTAPPATPTPPLVSPPPRAKPEESWDFETVVLTYCTVLAAHRRAASRNFTANIVSGLAGDPPRSLAETRLGQAYRGPQRHGSRNSTFSPNASRSSSVSSSRQTGGPRRGKSV